MSQLIDWLPRNWCCCFFQSGILSRYLLIRLPRKFWLCPNPTKHNLHLTNQETNTLTYFPALKKNYLLIRKLTKYRPSKKCISTWKHCLTEQRKYKKTIKINWNFIVKLLLNMVTDKVSGIIRGHKPTMTLNRVIA